MFGPLSLLLPPLVLLTSLATLPFTVLILTVTGRSSSLLSWPNLRHAWFKHFWWWFGPGSKAVFAPSVKPLLLQARGFVLDIGPASGVWMPELAAAARNGKISKIYGVEPNEEFQGPLREAAKRAGLADVYEPVAAFAQDLEARGIEKGSVDTIVTVHVLCSVGPHAEELVKVLYDFLKPGGQWLVYEHVAAQNSPARMCQAVCNVPWGTLLDGCHLQRDTAQTLRAAGHWEMVSIGPDSREGYFESLPHIVGRLVKKAA